MSRDDPFRVPGLVQYESSKVVTRAGGTPTSRRGRPLDPALTIEDPPRLSVADACILLRFAVLPRKALSELVQVQLSGKNGTTCGTSTT